MTIYVLTNAHICVELKNEVAEGKFSSNIYYNIDFN